MRSTLADPRHVAILEALVELEEATAAHVAAREARAALSGEAAADPDSVSVSRADRVQLRAASDEQLAHELVGKTVAAARFAVAPTHVCSTCGHRADPA